MERKNDTIFTGGDLRKMRIKKGMPLKQFWGNLGYSITCGSRYEGGKTRIPEHVRRLVNLHYVLGIPTDPDSQEWEAMAGEIKQNQPVRQINAIKLIEKGMGILKNAIEEK